MAIYYFYLSDISDVFPLQFITLVYFKYFIFRIRITFLSRQTKYRKIVNEDELVSALQENDEYHVQKVAYNRDVPFKKQLEISRNTDILIGIHGAGLTHSLFLPNWGAVFET